MPNENKDFEATQTRREFIRKVLVKTAYATPLIVTFSVSEVSARHAGKPMGSGKGHEIGKGHMKSPKQMMPMMSMGMGMLWS